MPDARAKASLSKPPSHVTKTLLPGHAGTVRLQQQHGDMLVCVRYRRDATGLRRTTTIEIVVAEGMVCSKRIDHKMFDVKIRYHERKLRLDIKAQGGKWDPDKQLWQLTGAAVKRLGLIDRVQTQPPTR